MDVYCFDFDGVICDSSAETGTTGYRACAKRWPDTIKGLGSAIKPPAGFLENFRQVLPALETGYESILIARLLLEGVDVNTILADFSTLSKAVMKQEKLDRDALITQFADMRDLQLKNESERWLNLHHFFEGMVPLVNHLQTDSPVYIITTKQKRYATKLCKHAGLKLPKDHVFGLEDGKKTDVLSQLREQHGPDCTIHFFEDRYRTLENVSAVEALAEAKLYLCSWGFTSKAEVKNASENSQVVVLNLEEMQQRWPVPEDAGMDADTESLEDTHVVQGDEHGEIVTIDDMAYGGDGVSRLPDGMTVFVPFTAIGDVVKIKVTERRKRFARGEVIDILQPSASRIEPVCKHFGYCGGCQYQHLPYDEQLRLKARQYVEILKRIGKIQNLPPLETVVGSPSHLGYRNKITMHPIMHEGAAVAYGFRDTRNLAFPVEECPIAAEQINHAIQSITSASVKAMDLTLRLGQNGRVFRYHDRPPRHAPWLKDDVLGQRLNVPLGSFAQINSPVVEHLIHWLRRQLEHEPPELLLDLYCGAGLFALTLGHLAKEVVGIERDVQSIQAAKFNAGKWGIEHARFYGGKVETQFAKAITEHGDDPDQALLLLDPPRGGCEKEVLANVAAWLPSKVVYISCNPASQARDLKFLLDSAEYALEKIALFDMFPQTAHFESVAILRRV